MGKRTVSGKGRRAKALQPFHVDEWTWFYATATKFTFVREVRDVGTGLLIRTEQVPIPARLLRQALALLDGAK
jgi:hypothetical protein